MMFSYGLPQLRMCYTCCWNEIEWCPISLPSVSVCVMSVLNRKAAHWKLRIRCRWRRCRPERCWSRSPSHEPPADCWGSSGRCWASRPADTPPDCGSPEEQHKTQSCYHCKWVHIKSFQTEKHPLRFRFSWLHMWQEVRRGTASPPRLACVL